MIIPSIELAPYLLREILPFSLSLNKILLTPFTLKGLFFFILSFPPQKVKPSFDFLNWFEQLLGRGNLAPTKKNPMEV